MHKTRRTFLLVALAALALGLLPVLAGAGACNSKSTSFYVPQADKGATQQIVSLLRHHDFKNAALLQKMVDKGHAVWLTGSTPAAVKKLAKQTMQKAHAKHQTPVFALYNIPGRDCNGYSAGGATDSASYAAWIDGVAQGIGTGKALVILEPDGLGLLPSSNCGGPTADYPFTDAERYAELNGAIDRLGRQPQVSVYLDATHNGWLNVGDAATRLVNGGVNRAAGFFLNVSNYQFTSNLVQYGTWVSQCIASGDYGACPNQYWNGGPPDWNGTALSPYGVWSDTASVLELSTAGINARYATMPAGTTHFVVDTSRNGLGPWDFSSKYTRTGATHQAAAPASRRPRTPVTLWSTHISG
jgi:endoglucanase